MSRPITAGDILSELDRAVIACENQRAQDDPEGFDDVYLQGVEDGLRGIRRYLRSDRFINSIIARSHHKCQST
jgi:hypothetical protein